MDASAALAILLVQEDAEARHTVSEFLRRLGCRVSVAKGSAEGLDAIDREPFDFVVSDWSGALGDGLSLWHGATDRRPWLRGRFIFCGTNPLPEGPLESERLLPTPLDLNNLWLEILVLSAWRGRAPQ